MKPDLSRNMTRTNQVKMVKTTEMGVYIEIGFETAADGIACTRRRQTPRPMILSR